MEVKLITTKWDVTPVSVVILITTIISTETTAFLNSTRWENHVYLKIVSSCKVLPQCIILMSFSTLLLAEYFTSYAFFMKQCSCSRQWLHRKKTDELFELRMNLCIKMSAVVSGTLKCAFIVSIRSGCCGLQTLFKKTLEIELIIQRGDIWFILSLISVYRK